MPPKYTQICHSRHRLRALALGMPRRKLGNLGNLNKHSPNAFSNTTETLKRKWKELSGKENINPKSIGRPSKLKKTRPEPQNTSSSDVSTHSASSRQSLPRRVLSSLLDAVVPTRLSRSSSPVSDITTDIPLPSTPSDTANLNNGCDGDLDCQSNPAQSSPAADSLDEMLTDPGVIDVPEGQQEAYTEPPSPADDEEEPENGRGTPWDARKPPTQVMALEALDAIKLLLFKPSSPGKKRRRIVQRKSMVGNDGTWRKCRHF
ncbi:hypothetical protein R3P38DRAFT_3214055 [Favolaschia claudopus]|uniref:Uncharacterized protein n=1 Tax=Favolaschia claudopus TaxID=2862362 RepID=A0AAW0AC04_9AGAR